MRWALVSVVLATWLVGCGPQEGPCSAPGVSCGAVVCSQSAFCNAQQQCEPKRVEGAACGDAAECLGGECSAGACVGRLVACAAR